MMEMIATMVMIAMMAMIVTTETMRTTVMRKTTMKRTTRSNGVIKAVLSKSPFSRPILNSIGSPLIDNMQDQLISTNS